jgi:2-polyprenyl-3-methyl-5-hydroxy-6-metoxy-1,4-benzoquinol methylase
MKSKELNSNASNISGARANVSYGNILDQKRYIYALKFVRGKDVLDCACGIGWGSFLLANGGAKSVVGVDLSPSAIESALVFYSAENIKFVLGAASDIDLNIKFDIITCFETLEHVDDPIYFLKNLKKNLKPGGMLILSTPNGFCFKYDKDKPYNPYHLDEYTKDDLFRALEQAGWCVDKYMGQHPIQADSEDVITYRNFIRRYWSINKLVQKYGLFYRILNRIYSQFAGSFGDPAHKTDCNPVLINAGFEPAYHFVIAH